MSVVLETYALQKDWEAYKLDIEKLVRANGYDSEEDAIAFARSFCYSVARKLWKCVDYRKRWKCRQLAFPARELDFSSLKLAMEISDYFLSLNIMEYAYLLGNLYTMLLPKGYRSDNGVFYTPPALAERLLDLLAAEGADWAIDNILDPACGGGAFLVTVANRMLGDYRIKELPAEAKLSHLEQHLAGIEIDKFAGWLTQVLLDIIVYSEAVTVGRRLKTIVRVQDTIRFALREERKFDVIVGNPPYGRVKLDEETRKVYSRSLYGHANLYGLFIDASLRMKTERGLVGFVTPTSFLGGKYYTNLRNLLSKMAPPLTIDFVSVRAGVFDQVLQETCLVTFGQNVAGSVTASKINIEDSTYSVERIGNFKVKGGTDPWIIAREPAEADIVNKVKTSKTTLKDYGYKVSTGQLVWNRLKGQIKDKPTNKSRPIIWAEAITSDGIFQFNYQYRNKLQYINVDERQQFLICNKSVVLVQRTTAKEQNRRLLSCVLPQAFIDQWNGVVVENHVNIIHPVTEEPKVSLEVLMLLLNSQVVDRIFRCLSGSVAVSATELHALPLPPIEKLEELEALLDRNHSSTELKEFAEKIITKAYGLEE
jgi:hypothetical protein